MRRPGAATAALVAALAALGLGACSGDDAASPATTTTAPTTTTTAVPLIALPTVLDPGAEPRRSLRLAYHAGDEAYAEKIHYWTTPIEQCLDGRTDVQCTTYQDWTQAWTEIKG